MSYKRPKQKITYILTKIEKSNKKRELPLSNVHHCQGLATVRCRLNRFGPYSSQTG